MLFLYNHVTDSMATLFHCPRTGHVNKAARFLLISLNLGPSSWLPFDFFASMFLGISYHLSGCCWVPRKKKRRKKNQCRPRVSERLPVNFASLIRWLLIFYRPRWRWGCILRVTNRALCSWSSLLLTFAGVGNHRPNNRLKRTWTACRLDFIIAPEHFPN